MENRVVNIKRWIEDRLKEKQVPYKVMFEITVPKMTNEDENIYNNLTLQKVRDIFNKYSIRTEFVDTVSGSFNLNRDWLETKDDVECYVEYCGVYPIHWNIEDVVELERMDYDGEIIIRAFWHVDKEYIPNH
jgi:hypothetical protein